jgi:hypothetical protein
MPRIMAFTSEAIYPNTLKIAEIAIRIPIAVL